MIVLRVFPTAHKIRKIRKTLKIPKEQDKSSLIQKSQYHFVLYARPNILRH